MVKQRNPGITCVSLISMEPCNALYILYRTMPSMNAVKMLTHFINRKMKKIHEPIPTKLQLYVTVSVTNNSQTKIKP